MIQAYEHENIIVDAELIFQYLQNEEIAQDFTMFYEEYSRYRKYYNINEILNGTITSDVSKRSQNAKTTEKIAVAHLLLNEVLIEICDAETEYSVIMKLHKNIKEILSNNDKSKALDSFIAEHQGKRKAGITAKNMNDKQLYKLTLLISILENTKLSITNEIDADSIIKNQFNNCIDNLEKKVNNISKHIDNMLSFIETYFKDKSLLTMAVRKMTENPDSVSFLSKYESTMYSEYCNLLQIDSKKSDIKEKIKHFTI